MSTADVAGTRIRSTIPARLDRLSWSPFHTRMVAGLGAAWILDGLQITIASSVTGVLVQPDTLDMSSTEVGMIASVYLVGQVIGALVFGRLSDQLGRKRLLIVTLLLYLFGTGLAIVICSPSRIQAAPSPATIRVWNGDQLRRSSRAGIVLRIVLLATSAVLMSPS